jgi:hypothetical protein
MMGLDADTVKAERITENSDYGGWELSFLVTWRRREFRFSLIG